jgi:myo-inositol-1(or 4)-monophosphatase
LVHFSIPEEAHRVRDALETARIAARAGGDVLESMRGAFGAVRTKSASTDLVTEADFASGIAVARAILLREPEARFIVEEDEVHERLGLARGVLGTDDTWVIDPIDGTTSFAHGYPMYCVSVALVAGDQPVAGAIYNAASRELFSAAEGLGATLDGNPIRVSGARSLRDALVATGFPYDRGAPLDHQLAVLAAFLRAPVHDIRRDGSAALDCCHVAAGRVDGFWEYELKPWDMAAGAVICREAGALVTAADGSPWTAAAGSILTANPTMHAEMLAVIRGA